MGTLHFAEAIVNPFVFIVLPEDIGRRFIDRNATTRTLIFSLLELLDRSLESWEGRNNSFEPLWPWKQDWPSSTESLSYIFNTLPSPSPTPAIISSRSARAAMRVLLQTSSIRGIKTQLHQYQKRSAAEMVRRESEPLRRLDPRFEAIQGPTGQCFYYNCENQGIYRDPQEYEDARGGILAETMGFGKTLICLAAILATKGHLPRIPPEHSLYLHPIRPKVGTLMQMTAATIGREQIPFRSYFQELADAGNSHDRCIAMLEENIGSYFIRTPTKESRRVQPAMTKWEQIHLCSATLILVPTDLFRQWENEIAFHVERDALKVLYLNLSEEKVPSKEHLLTFDVILMSQKRFEQEVDNQNAIYQSPLKELHFLRVIADEGHTFASSTGWKNKATQALQNLHVERRWVVSGTPAAGLFGMEVDLASNETNSKERGYTKHSTESNLALLRNASPFGQEQRDLIKLGSLVTDFLNLKPWANARNKDFASWHSHMMPDKSGRRKRSLRRVLESLVVRHRLEDVGKDLILPPLYNRVVYLTPSFFDKLSINLFVLFLTANAVTSDKVGRDYMFHRRNRGQLQTLISNLRQSGFYWTGFSPSDVGETLEFCMQYLKKATDPNWSGSVEDRKLLESAVGTGTHAKDSATWAAFADLQEIGLYVKSFPTCACENWSLVSRSEKDSVAVAEYLLVGATQLLEAQQFVDSHLYDPEPTKGLADLGKSLMQVAWQNVLGTKRRVNSTLPNFNQIKNPQKKRQLQKGQVVESLPCCAQVEPFEPNSPLRSAEICGTASAKFSYILDKIIALHQEEKIIIFYEGDQIAYYIAQGLDLLRIKYRIYTRTLSFAERNAYIEAFNRTEACRVFLMNVKLAAHGLHLAAASRVFFINPVWQPNVEAQAIKRAHRIGQTRPVYVETLVLEETLEDQMLQRRKQMTTAEHETAKKSLLDDPRMLQIIQNARPISISKEQLLDVRSHMAPLQTPQQLFGRGYAKFPPIQTSQVDTPGNLRGNRKRKASFVETS